MGKCQHSQLIHGQEEVSFQLLMDGIENLFTKGMVGISNVGRNKSREVVTLKKGFV